MHFERRMALDADGRTIRIAETIENLGSWDRPMAWTQHVTLGPPFLQCGRTEFRNSATKSKVFEADFGKDQYMKVGAEFEWPNVPLKEGGTADLRRYTDRAASAAFTTHLMDPARDEAFFAAWSPESKVLFGYRWRRADFPWLGMWEEYHSRTDPPWNSQTLTCGMEFG